MADFRILSLDGGGPWALLQVMALMDIYGDIPGHDVLKKFDLAAANSGGSLTLGGLIMNWPLSEMLNIFLDPNKRSQIFVPATFFEDPFAHLTQIAGLGPKYHTQGKYVGLRNIFGAVGDSPVTAVPEMVGPGYADRKPNVLFCAFDYDANRETFFRSDTQSLAASLAPPVPASVTQAIHASANPPVNYFDAPAQFLARRYWDGAVGGYNNPVLAAVIEAVANLSLNGAAIGSIKALSIGTGNVSLPRAQHLPNEDPDMVAPSQGSTIVNDVKKMASSILDDPPDAATFHAHVLLGGPLLQPGNAPPVNGPIVRMNPLIQPLPGVAEPWVFPTGLDRSAFVAIRDMPMDATKQEQVTSIQNFGKLWLADNVPNQPIRANALTLEPEIGFGRYQPAKIAAKAMFP